MYPANFEYARPSTIEEAIALLSRHGDDAKVLAGGHSLIPAMKLRLARPKVVVDIGRIANLNSIRFDHGRLAIGAVTTHADIAASGVLRAKCPVLPETARHIGDVQVRNKGTIGGSLVHADPAADYPAAMLALNAEMELIGPKGKRVVRVADFFVDLLQSAVGPDEILTEIRVPETTPAVAYVKTEQKASGFAVAGVAAVMGTAGFRIGVTGVASKAYRASAVEHALAKHKSPKPEDIAQAAMLAAHGVRPLSDIHASAEYRAHLAQVNTRRAIEMALSRVEQK
ncbi:MAG TPA: xanthine dehydrogenase family protein subunit M [Vicinamibacterales bacterium]|nr:xanthine dehydrogenase family protein subunit M [Vicinamibacterales bacterium]